MRENKLTTGQPGIVDEQRPAPIQLSTTIDMNNPVDPDDMPPPDYAFWLTAKVVDLQGNVVGNVRDLYPPPPADEGMPSDGN